MLKLKIAKIFCKLLKFTTELENNEIKTKMILTKIK